MKAQILKIAGVKTEAEFYKKYPTEEAFMKKHGKELQKAQTGKVIPGLDVSQSIKTLPTLSTNNIKLDTTTDGTSSTSKSGGSGKLGKIFTKDKLNAGLETLANNADDILAGIQGMRQDQQDIKNLKKSADVASVVAAAAGSTPQLPKKRYVRPEDALLTNPLSRGKKGAGVFKKGGKVKGNPTEIQNTYDPYDIYTDQGYLPIAQKGINLDSLSGLAGGLGGMLGSATGKGTGKGGNASTIGSAIGGIAGSFIPLPGVGTALGSLAGGFIGGLIDSDTQNKKQAELDRMQGFVDAATLSNGAKSLQMQNKGFMQDGGYMNPEYNPQVIAKFGDYDVDQLFAPPHDADMLRAGGHLKEYTPPSASAMYTGRDLPYQMQNGGQMAMGGDLQVHRGEAETMSYNPYLPDGGETVMFRGPSHDNGGMPISYGENGVEVEGGEPAIKLQDGGSPDGNLVVYGNMVIPGYGAAEIGDEKAKGKKFKHYVADLSKTEAKQNKLIDKTSLMLDGLDENDPFDQLKLNVGQANLLGANMKLKSIADKKKNAAAVQNAILDTAEEYGLESDALAKGQIKYAKANDPYAEFGASLDKAKDGKSLGKFVSGTPFAKRAEMAKTYGISGYKGTAAQNKQLFDLVNNGNKEVQDFVKQIPLDERKAMAAEQGVPFFRGTPLQNKWLFGTTKEQGQKPDVPVISKLPLPIPTKYNTKDEMIKAMDKSIANDNFRYYPSDDTEDTGNDMNWWETGANALASVMPYIRPTNQIPLDATQLQGEMYALANNQEEPVYAQTYNPLLSQTSNITLQDQINAITSQARSAERMAQNNPEALAMIASQAADAKTKVLGEQFRMNQAEQQRVMEANRQTLNDAQLKNLGIFDQQQQRQAQAKSNTKQQAIVALNSISDKIAKNKLENRELAISENLYNYRFAPNGQAYNLNSPYLFAPYGSGSGTGQVPTGMVPEYEADDNGKPKITGYKFPKETKTKKRNGAIVQAIKNL